MLPNACSAAIVGVMSSPTLQLLGLIEIEPHVGAIAEECARHEGPVAADRPVGSVWEDGTLTEAFERLANRPSPTTSSGSHRRWPEPSSRLLADCRKLVAELQSIAAAARIAVAGSAPPDGDPLV